MAAMKHMISLIFCSVTLAATLLLCWALFPLAALSRDELAASSTPTDAELFEDVSVEGFGDIPVFDMVLHYIDNPPAETSGGETEVRFQGC